MWWKGGKKVAKIKYDLVLDGYMVKEVWGVTQEQLAEEFNTAQFVLIPSEAESFCLVSVQAQACGCIPIAHDVGGVSETIMQKELLYKDESEILGILKKVKLSETEAECEMRSIGVFDIQRTSNKFHIIMSYA